MARYLVGLINYYEREALDIAEDIFLYDEGYDASTITKLE